MMKNHEGNDVEIGEDHTWVEALSNEKEAERRMVSRMRYEVTLFCHCQSQTPILVYRMPLYCPYLSIKSNYEQQREIQEWHIVKTGSGPMILYTSQKRNLNPVYS